MDEVQVGPAGELPGDPDGLQRLWTPHRMSYIAGGAGGECPFCRVAAGTDDLVLRRGERALVVMNLYPYNSGHLMVVPNRHIADFTELEPEEVAEIGTLTQQAVRALRAAMAPHGFNLGLNQGSAAGAGIAAHLHLHVVPRWGGDTNFLPIIGRTKALPELLADSRQRIAAAWEE